MNEEQWIEFTAAPTERERTALALLRGRLPDFPPFKAWANFQFLALDSAFFKVHALIFSPAGVFLLRLFTRNNRLDLGADTWLHTNAHGEVQALDNPLALAALEADKLHALLEHFTSGNYHVPKIQPLVFVTDPDIDLHVDHDAGSSLFFHPDLDGRPSILDALIDGRGPGLHRPSRPLNRPVLERFEEVVDEAAFEPATRHRRFQDYRLEELLDTTAFYQDFVATQASTDELLRARVFRAPRGAGSDLLARLQAAARREFSIVSELDHPNILQATHHVAHNTQPIVFFDHDQRSRRLDHYLEQTPNLSATARFKILESVAEAIRYAHSRRVIHRALTPQSVLVIPDAQGQPARVLVHNWHTGRHDERETGTQHISDYLHDKSRLFLAPELGHSPDVDEAADVFGLGAITFFLFSGEPPARDLPDYIQTIFDHGGLRLSSRQDAVSPELDNLVFDATRARPDERIHSAEAFQSRHSQARASLLAISNSGPIDPLDANPGDLIADRYRVLQRLGSGATATAFLVQHDDKQLVLKIAHDDDHAGRLEAEAEALKKLDHPLIVDAYDLFRAGSRTILAIQYAGKTFRDRLRESRALSLDNLHRFGTDLCEICQALESQRVFHRDIKPSNLGLAERSSYRERLHLMLFDFSLAGVPIDKVGVGTTAYRDPFLSTRLRWDTYADRYSAALVLYEMVTQKLPQWGDGRTNPTVDPEAILQLAPERFPASIRDELRSFFHRALARDIKDRFDNAAEMAQAWRDVFERTLTTDHGTDTLEARLQKARPATRLNTLGISQLAIDALDSQDITTVAQLLSKPTNAFTFLTGVSGQTRKEILAIHESLSDLFPGLTFGTEHQTEHTEPADYALKSVDHLLDYVLEKRGGSARADLAELISTALSPDSPDDALPWAGPDALAARADLSPAEFADHFGDLTARWLKKRSLIPLRDDIVDLIDSAGGILAATHLSRAVLGKRGSVKTGPARLAAASAVTRAGVEAELVAPNPRIAIRRHQGETFIATRQALLDLLPDLGQLASRFAAEDPLASPERAFTAIVDLLERANLDLLPRFRALALACAASQDAALSQRDEIYPRGMSATRALTLTANVLLRQAPLSEDKLRATVKNRYPEAAPLPDELPGLEQALRDADVDLKFDTGLLDGRGAFVFAHEFSDGPRLSRSTQAHPIYRSSTSYTVLHDVDTDLRRFTDRLDYRQRNGGFLALTVAPAYYVQAPEHLRREYDLEVHSLESIFLRHLRDHAAQKNIQWHTLLRADGPRAGDRDRDNFSIFLSRFVVPSIRDELLAMTGRILLTHAGLLARWNDTAATMSLIDTLRDELTSGRGPELLWLLIPGDAQKSRPLIDGVPVPVTNDSEYTRIPSRWLNP